MPVIIDGNNLLHSLPNEEQNRDSVRRQALDVVRDGGMSLNVVFDGPAPEGSPDAEHLGRLTIRYSGTTSADNLILGLLRSGNASDWVVVTDDRALRDRVRERGGQVRTLNDWRSRNPRKRRHPLREMKLSPREVSDWETFFASRDDDTES
jgi:hypothetical protein